MAAWRRRKSRLRAHLRAREGGSAAHIAAPHQSITQKIFAHSTENALQAGGENALAAENEKYHVISISKETAWHGIISA